jgi:hypothetical protein
MVPAMRTLPLAALLLLAASPARADDQRVMVMDFDRIQVDGPYRVTLTVGPTASVVATGTRGALDRVAIDVQGRTLRVRPNRSAWGGGYPGDRVGGPVTIQASTRELRAATVVGAGSISIDRAKGLRIDLNVSGSGRLGVASLDADQLFANLTGSGRIMVGGKARQLRAVIGGSGDLDGSALRVENADLIADTSGAIAFTAIRAAKVRANGAGDVAIAGTAACTVTGLAADLVRCGGPPPN